MAQRSNRPFYPHERRLWVKLISAQALDSYMRFRSETNRSLATKTAPNAKRGIIGHLRSGQRDTCSPETAAAIERGLNAPPGSLFVPEVSSVALGTGHRWAS